MLGPEIYNGYSSPEIFLKPRGSEGRTPTYWTLDLHAHYDLPLLGGRMSLIADVFNATNNNGVLVVDQSYIYPAMSNFAEWSAPENLDEYGNPGFNPNLTGSPYFKTTLVESVLQHAACLPGAEIHAAGPEVHVLTD